MSSQVSFFAAGFRKKISRMIGAEHPDSLKIVKPPPQPPNRGWRIEQILGGDRSQAADELGLDQLQLPPQKMPTIGRFLRRGVAIPWWSAFENIQYVNLFASKLAGSQNAIQELTCFAHKGLPLPIFVGPGASPKKQRRACGFPTPNTV